MKLHDSFVRRQLEVMSSVADKVTLSTARKAQDAAGSLIRFTHRNEVVEHEREKNGMRAVLTVPRDELRGGIILYLHGGGYACGSLDYVRGCASMISAELGIRVFAPEYRLAPEHPYPAAIDDAHAAYRWIMEIGYTPDRIVLAGESAGGGLCYALCQRLRESGDPMPAGIVALSPWCDLSLVGESYDNNKDKDPSLTKKRLEFFRDCYLFGDSTADDKPNRHVTTDGDERERDPYASPVYADLSGMPPSFILAGASEILLSDAERMHAALKARGSKSTLHVKPDMWHAYLMYSLESNKEDFELISEFVKKIMPRDNERKLRWMHLDNAAKIYPAAATRRWTNLFRLSATLTEEVDREVLQSALDVTVRRFPSIAVRLCRGVFWYYLEEIPRAPGVKDEQAYPLVRMPFDDRNTCAFRVLVYGRRIAVEFFHSLTDGNGGLVFLKTLVAEYISQKYGIEIPAERGVLDRLEPPHEDELRDLYPEHCTRAGDTRQNTDAFHLVGDYEPDGYCHNTTLIMDSNALREKSRELGVTVTAFMTAVFMTALIGIQNEICPETLKQKEVKVLVPVDLRRVFGGNTLRNFAYFTVPSIDPRLGEYTFEEIADIVSRQMQLDITQKNMRAKIYPNVRDEQNPILKIAPLFLKDIAMKTVFSLVGERKSTLSLSNLGLVDIPDAMKPYVDHFDFVLGHQSTAPYNAGMLSYGGVVRLNMIRNTKEPRLERALYEVLRSRGVKVKVESNFRPEPPEKR